MKVVKRYFWVIIFVLFSTGSLLLGFEPGELIYRNFTQFLLELVAFLPLMFLLVGLFDVWVPKEAIEKHIGGRSGFAGAFWVILLAMLQAGPLYAAFPVAYLLSKKGASVRNIFIYIGAFSCLKLPLLTFEVSFLGWRFMLLRSLFTLPLFIVIGLIMERVLGQGYKVKAG
ncbi:MAG: permease [Candidatus Margulisbacteria bacterium]|jgi:uncharacterized membrane protein YraQ (UPF0718 family)|nr:permease [Candidatus Margulisiibacteriota bacterium]